MIFAWQGWQLEIPDDWSPVKLDGTFESGYALLSDIHRARVGVRWATPPPRFDSEKWAIEAMAGEVGRLAANDAEVSNVGGSRDGLLYLEVDPPGRDVWVATSEKTGRTIQIVHHVYENEPSEMVRFQQGLTEADRDDELSWSVFDLSCRSGIGWRLEKHRLNAGDFILEFIRGSERLTIRCIALANLALKRMSLQQWLEEQSRPRLKGYTITAASSPFTLKVSDGRELSGVSALMQRKLLAMWNVSLPANVTQVAVHDPMRDRLILMEGDEPAVKQLGQSIGWAYAKGSFQEIVF